MLSTKIYEINSLYGVSIDIVDGATFYFIDTGLVLPFFGLVDANFVIRNDLKNKLEIVHFSVSNFNILIDEREKK